MIRILTVLLLPLLFIATSCDSGGEGSACAVNPSGHWEFTKFDLTFSESCDCGEANDCNALYGGSILNEADCVIPYITGGNIFWDSCMCYYEDTPVRNVYQCDDGDFIAEEYGCSDATLTIPTVGGRLWTVSPDLSTIGTTIEQSIEDFVVDGYIPGPADASNWINLSTFTSDWSFDPTANYGVCTVTSEIEMSSTGQSGE